MNVAVLNHVDLDGICVFLLQIWADFNKQNMQHRPILMKSDWRAV